uniref:NADH-ubiquinone oxidoreductase chain 5 n=1 Tax=Cylindrus obtusus TaxID=649475 RepID=I1T1W9_9EUPU|nr:NADH dehydrogenase subunit 5 [Cylindrus obtusus]AEK48349.1 NADH dehydrogenase subunit 5 [Cylindrus obtusus]
MMKKHSHRLTVLLFLSFSGYMSLYLGYTLPSMCSTLFSYDTMVVTTHLFSSSLLFDSTSVSFSAVVTFISANVFMFARYYMSGDIFYYRFVWLLFSFVISMNILILAGSLFVLLLGWDGLGVSSFALIMYYESKESLAASFLTLLINRLGDLIIMGSMVVFIFIGFSVLVSYPPVDLFLIFLLLSCAALTKSAQYPFCAWLPAAMAAPTPVSALVHSSTLVTAGVYIIIRASTSNPLPMEVGSMLLFFGSVTSFIGGLCAVYENDLKKLIALSTLSQLGVMMFSLGLGAYNLALLHLFTHAMFKALLFLVAGCILLLSYGVQDIRLLGALTKNSPLLLVFLNISGFCLMGLPFLSAFFSKHLILTAMWSYYVNIFSLLLMLFSTLLSSVYMIRLLKCLNWGPVATPLVAAPYYSPLFYTPMCFLFIGSCFLGWVLSAMDLHYSDSFFVPAWLDGVLYSVMLTGMGGGLLLSKLPARSLAVSMFYMAPVWCNINLLSYHLLAIVKALDYGWLEPMSYKAHLLNFLPSTIFNIVWPKTIMSFFPPIAFLGGVLVLCYYSLK